MKEGIHPNYREVCFVDLSNNFKFVTRSCANTKEMIKLEDGRELPLFKLDTSSESHPFYTGTQKSVDNMAWSRREVPQPLRQEVIGPIASSGQCPGQKGSRSPAAFFFAWTHLKPPVYLPP